MNNPLRNLLRQPESESAACKQEEALALRAYEAVMAWHEFRKKHWAMLTPLSSGSEREGQS